MIFYYLLISIFFQNLPLIFSDQQLVCTLRTFNEKNNSKNGNDLWFNGVAILTYKRTNLAVYKYNNTQWVNLLHKGVKIHFEGTYYLTKDAHSNISLFVPTVAEGLSLILSSQSGTDKNEDNKRMSKCEFNFKKNAKYTKTFASGVQQNLIDLSAECLQQKLCSEIGLITQDDYIRGSIEPYDFKKYSAPYKAYSEKFYNLAAPYLSIEQDTRNNATTTINLIVDFLASYGISQMSKKNPGIIEFPDIKESLKGVAFIDDGYYHLSNGTVGDLRSITRAQNVVLSSEGHEFSIELAYKIPKPYIHFEYIEFKYGFYNPKGKLDIFVENVYFKIKLFVNFNETPCKMGMPTVDIEIGKIKLQLSKNITFKNTISKILTKIVGRMNDDITDFAKTKIADAIPIILGKFDCEDFRP